MPSAIFASYQPSGLRRGSRLGISGSEDFAVPRCVRISMRMSEPVLPGEEGRASGAIGVAALRSDAKNEIGGLARAVSGGARWLSTLAGAAPVCANALRDPKNVAVERVLMAIIGAPRWIVRRLKLFLRSICGCLFSSIIRFKSC